MGLEKNSHHFLWFSFFLEKVTSDLQKGNSKKKRITYIFQGTSKAYYL